MTRGDSIRIFGGKKCPICNHSKINGYFIYTGFKKEWICRPCFNWSTNILFRRKKNHVNL